MGFKHKKKDAFYNRRRLMVYSAIYGVVWGFILLVCYLMSPRMSDTALAMFLGYITTLSGTGILGYLYSVRKNEKENPNDSNS